MLAWLLLALTLTASSVATADAQSWLARRTAACRCEPSDKTRKPRFLLPVAGGFGFLPLIAARDSQLPALGLPSLVDIRDETPRNALEGERELAVGALAPNTATVLPTVMLIAASLLLCGAYMLLPRRKRGGRAFWRTRDARPRGGWRLRTIHRRRIGIMFSGAGSLLVLLGSREYAEGARAQRQARAEWLQVGSDIVRIDEPTVPTQASRAEKAETDGTVGSTSPAPNAAVRSVVPLPVLAMSGREIRRGAPVARLLIPTIALDEIVMEGVGPVELNGGPGHFPGSVLPGESGNSILSAHRDRHFRRVGELGVGSRIRTETRTGVVDWVVTERRIVSRDTPALFEESVATLTLTTCWPLRYFGPAPDRLLIIAKPVS